MLHIKRFVDKVSHLESKKTKDVVIPIAEARGLRDEIAKLLVDLNELQSKDAKKDEIIRIEVQGGTFK